MERLTEAEALPLIIGGRESKPQGNWQCVGDMGLGEYAWVHRDRPEAIVHRVVLMGYEPASPEMIFKDIEGHFNLEREASREVRLLGTVLHHTLTHHDLSVPHTPALTTLWAEAWPNHNLYEDDTQDGHHDTVEVEDWTYDYLNTNLTPSGLMPLTASVIWQRALKAIDTLHTVSPRPTYLHTDSVRRYRTPSFRSTLDERLPVCHKNGAAGRTAGGE